MKLAVAVVLFAVVSLAYSEPQTTIRRIHFTLGGPGGAAKSAKSGLGGLGGAAQSALGSAGGTGNAGGAANALGSLGGGPGAVAKSSLGGMGGMSGMGGLGGAAKGALGGLGGGSGGAANGALNGLGGSAGTAAQGASGGLAGGSGGTGGAAKGALNGLGSAGGAAKGGAKGAKGGKNLSPQQIQEIQAVLTKVVGPKLAGVVTKILVVLVNGLLKKVPLSQLLKVVIKLVVKLLKSNGLLTKLLSGGNAKASEGGPKQKNGKPKNLTPADQAKLIAILTPTVGPYTSKYVVKLVAHLTDGLLGKVPLHALLHGVKGLAKGLLKPNGLVGKLVGRKGVGGLVSKVLGANPKADAKAKFHGGKGI